MIPHLADVRAAAAALLDVGLDGVDAVYDREQNAETSGPCWVTVSVERILATEIVVAVRIYSSLAESPDDATDVLETALEGVDARLGSVALGPSEWDIGVDDTLNAMVARSFVNWPRQTF